MHLTMKKIAAIKMVRNLGLTALLIAPSLITLGQVENHSSLLWKISGNGLEHTSYLFGTIHALPQERFFLPDSLKNKLEKCDKLVLEIDMDDPTMMGKLQQGMVMVDNSIDNILSHDDYLIVEKFFNDSLHIPLSAVSKVKPMLLASFMLPKIIGQNPASYEGNLVQLATESGKEVLGLETVQEQISYIDKVPLEQQAKMLVEGITDYEKSKMEYDMLLKAYESEDVEKIYTYMLETSNDFKNFDEILLKERNRNWVPRIVAMASKNPCFFAVGSGHLGGSEGVIALLRKEGYTVEPVR